MKIVTDTSTLFSPSEGKELGITVLPLNVGIKGKTYKEFVDMHAPEFIRLIKEGNIPTSSQPSVGETLEVFENTEEDIVVISMADGLSGTYQSNVGVKNSLDKNDHIHIINTKTLCGPHRYMVEIAQKMKEEGKTAQEIMEWLEYASEHHESFLIPQDFDFLRRGGRLTPMAAAFGSVLKLKPIMTQTKDGKKLDKFAVKRTMKAAVGAIIDHMKEVNIGEKHMVYVSHARALHDAEKAMAQLKEAFPEAEYQMLDLGAAFVTQGGPQCVAIQYIEK